MNTIQELRPARAPERAAVPEDRTADDEIDLGALLATIWRGKWFISFVTLLAIIAGGYYAFAVAVPKYRATSVVMLETQQKQFVELDSVLSGLTGERTEVNSELEVLRSRSLIGKVVDKLQLVDDPEFNSGLRDRSQIAALRSTISRQIQELLGAVETKPITLPPEEKEKRQRDRVIDALLNSLSMSNARDTLVFKITAETESAVTSARIADTIADLYVRNQLETKFEATEQATVWLTERVSSIKLQLEEAEQKLADFNSSTELVSIEALQGQEIQLKELRIRISEAEISAIDAKKRFDAMRQARTRTEKVLATGDPALQRLFDQMVAGEVPEAAFDARFNQVLARAELQAGRLTQQSEALKKSAILLSDQIERQSKDLIELQQFKREAEAIRLLYEYFLTRLNETAAQRGIQQADSRVLSYAVVPNRASDPRKSMMLVLSGVLGIMIGTGLVLITEMRRNQGFRTARDLETHTGISVLGQIPQIPKRNRKQALKYVIDKPTSAAAEAIRNLRTSVLMSNIDDPPQLITVTSSVPGEGKTTTALALAHNLSGLGKSVLLLEGDIRRRTLGQYFKNAPRNGLLAVLNDEKALKDAVFRPSEYEVDVLFGEKANANAADIFSSEKFKSLIKEVRSTYDFVIIDTPPVLAVPDARIIAQVTDALLLAVQWDKTTRHQVDEALRIFQTSDQHITGFILQQINSKKMKAYGYGGKYSAYAGYGSKYYTN